MENDTQKPDSPRPPKDGEEPLDPASCSLFIGGDSDGKRLEIKDDPLEVIMPVKPVMEVTMRHEFPPQTEVQKYRREIIGAPAKTWILYVFEGLTMEDAMDSLMSAYGENT